jgi:hypothetical protein
LGSSIASQHELYILHVALALYSYGPSSCDHTDALTIPLFSDVRDAPLVHRYLIQDSSTLQWPKAGNHLQWCPNPKLDSVTKLGKIVEKDLVPWSTCSNSKLWFDDEATCDLITGEKNYSSMCSCLLAPSHQNLDFNCFSGRLRAPWHHLLWSLKSNSCHKLPNLQPTYRNSYHLVCLLSCIICLCHVIITSSFYCCLIPNLHHHIENLTFLFVSYGFLMWFSLVVFFVV